MLGQKRVLHQSARGPPQVVFVRGISHTPGLITSGGSYRALVAGLDELERAQSNLKVSLQSSSRIFLHSLYELEDTSPREIAVRFQRGNGSS
jgi:acetyl-CoA carboxylase/biotin carboxylase 1